uniref:Lysosomal associated membrane protein family member 5 n=1 Tax=Eptatretus burgeri TaxID=7764 RepID=A0A8C4NI07_EPTBU
MYCKWIDCLYAYTLRVPCTFYVRILGARTYCTVRAPAVAVASGASAGEDAGISLEDNGTTCLMAKFAIKFLIPYDVWASNFVDLVTEEATIAMPKNVKIRGNCAESNTSQKPELVLSWHEESYVLNFQFDTVSTTMHTTAMLFPDITVGRNVEYTMLSIFITNQSSGLAVSTLTKNQIKKYGW